MTDESEKGATLFFVRLIPKTFGTATQFNLSIKTDVPMVYKWQKLKMKKVLMLGLMFFAFAMYANAQVGTDCWGRDENGYFQGKEMKTSTTTRTQKTESKGTSETQNSGSWNAGANASGNASVGTSTKAGVSLGINGGYSSGSSSNTENKSSSNSSETQVNTICVPNSVLESKDNKEKTRW